MNIKTNLIEEYVNFVDNTKKENKNLWIYLIIVLVIVFILVFIIIFLFENINEYYSFLKRNKKNSTMDPNMLTKYYKLKIMNDFMNIKYQNPKMTQSQISSQLNMSPSTIKRYRNDINMISPYRNNPKNVKKQQKKAKIDDNGDLKRPNLISNDLKTTSNDKKTRSKNTLKGGFVQEENIEINEHYLDKILKNNNT